MLAIVWLLQRRLARGNGAAGRPGRFGRPRSRGTRTVATADITLVAKRGIGPKAQVAVVEIDGARYVLGITEGGVSMLDRIDPVTGTNESTGTSTPAPVPAPAMHPALRDAAGDAPLAPPLPLRRSQARAERSGRSGAPAAMTARDAAQVLRRALGA
ncbi:flagellar biosynthetic protein FliO [Microbacterium sp. cf332]|uniref:flagellar biosynthetic protein FliO n=1 Tax=Microbacterium sp. cf332 TaxID=1761804 RepID=UPI000891C88F|nr:flagellar biosynthetic protein FliO [Microbacterium sp. cf332]SDQ50854.1 Flagellar biosynthesis protein, FliO [Microbacterium sp. cf332]